MDLAFYLLLSASVAFSVGVVFGGWLATCKLGDATERIEELERRLERQMAEVGRLTVMLRQAEDASRMSSRVGSAGERLPRSGVAR